MSKASALTIMEGCPKPTRPDTVAILVLVVEYDKLPDIDNLNELMDKSREEGGPVRADLYSLAPAKSDLL